jgi:hypothetical protein
MSAQASELRKRAAADEVPGRDAAPADAVLGQFSMTAGGENRWTSVDPDTFCRPYGLSLHGDRLAVADSGNNRVMVWRHP